MSSNMHLLYFNFVVLLSVCGLRWVDCEPTLTPLKGSKVFEFNGSNYYDLTWDYNTDGRTIKEVQLKYIGAGNNDETVAGRSPTGQLQVNPASGYTDSKISFFGSLSGNVGQITFRISKIVQSDSRIFKCDLCFNSFNPPDIQSSVELVVVVAPRITMKSPRTVTLDEGNTITLLCVATGNPKPTITWTKDSEVKQQTSITNYTISPAAKKEAGTYTCEARVAAPGLGEQTDNYQVTVTVRYKPQIDFLTANQTANDGTDVSFFCRADAVPTPTAYNWFKNGVPIPRGSSGDFVNSGQELTVKNVKKDSAGRYSCSSTNVVGTGEERSTFLSVNFRPRFNPPDTLPTTKQIRNENQTIDYTCTAEAKPYASIRWMLNGQNLTNIPPYNITERISGPAASKLFTTFGYLNIKHLTWQQYGNFSCVAINDAGSVKQNTELEVRYRPVVQSPADHPKNLTLAEGETATFNCKTIGNPPTTAHKWQFNGNDLQGEACSNCPKTTLKIGSVERNDEGWYGCVGTNSLGDGPPTKAQLLIKHSIRSDYLEMTKNKLSITV